MREDIKMQPLTRTLDSMSNGSAIELATAELYAVIEAVKTVGKPGKLVMTLTVTPATKSPTIDRVSIELATQAKPPKLPAEDTLFFIGEDGNLTRRDPVQERLDLRPVDNTITLREVE